mmetsp:Transcript_12921/g.29738  ORF Transcript_12921/g.29738 Transcript_12921/m.29738 type:complete len:222 (+) Transcript_12921:1441-2106(+)
MYLDGAAVLGPSRPNKCRICVLKKVNSQSSMNSQRWRRPASLASGMQLIRVMIDSTMHFLKSNPPSSRKMPDRKVMRVRCLAGYLRQSVRMASTTTILNSSAISDMKVVICFIKRSTEDSLPVLSNVVIARVAMERLESEIIVSRSKLQAVTERGCSMAILLRARTPANRRVGLLDVKNSCSTIMAGLSSRAVTFGRSQIARAASQITISLLWRKQLSRNS